MVNGHAMLEYMMQHAAEVMKVTPLELRMKNLMHEGIFMFSLVFKPITINSSNKETGFLFVCLFR